MDIIALVLFFCPLIGQMINILLLARCTNNITNLKNPKLNKLLENVHIYIIFSLVVGFLFAIASLEVYQTINHGVAYLISFFGSVIGIVFGYIHYDTTKTIKENK